MLSGTSEKFHSVHSPVCRCGLRFSLSVARPRHFGAPSARNLCSPQNQNHLQPQRGGIFRRCRACGAEERGAHAPRVLPTTPSSLASCDGRLISIRTCDRVPVRRGGASNRSRGRLRSPKLHPLQSPVCRYDLSFGVSRPCWLII